MKKSQQKTPVHRQYSLKPAQQQAFLEVFNLHAEYGKISRKDLRDIFNRIGFKISEQNFQDIVEKAFLGKVKISFEQFMETFKVKQSKYDLVDIKNAFRLIAGDCDDYVPVQRMKELFEKQGVEKYRIEELFSLLETYIDQKNMFNFKLFLSHLG